MKNLILMLSLLTSLQLWPIDEYEAEGADKTKYNIRSLFSLNDFIEQISHQAPTKLYTPENGSNHQMLININYIPFDGHRLNSRQQNFSKIIRIKDDKESLKMNEYYAYKRFTSGKRYYGSLKIKRFKNSTNIKDLVQIDQVTKSELDSLQLPISVKESKKIYLAQVLQFNSANELVNKGICVGNGRRTEQKKKIIEFYCINAIYHSCNFVLRNELIEEQEKKFIDETRSLTRVKLDFKNMYKYGYSQELTKEAILHALPPGGYSAVTHSPKNTSQIEFISTLNTNYKNISKQADWVISTCKEDRFAFGHIRRNIFPSTKLKSGEEDFATASK